MGPVSAAGRGCGQGTDELAIDGGGLVQLPHCTVVAGRSRSRLVVCTAGKDSEGAYLA